MLSDMDERKALLPEKGFTVFLYAAFAAAFLVVFSSPALHAHPPSNVSLSYDQKNGLLVVTVTHDTKDAAGHYIKTVEIRNNGKMVRKAAYTDQPSPATFTYVYPVPATAGDVLSAKATCSISGSGEEKITVPKTPR